MKSSAKKVELASVDDLFSTEESRADAQRERVLEIPLSELHPFKNHPFKVKDDESMMETADSIRQYGVLVPAIARPDPDGGYELVAGHRRHRASELADKETMPVIVRDLDDDAATIIMVDSNLQRESLLPSERAFAYKMKLDAMKHQGERRDLTCAQVGHKSDGKKSRDILAEQVGQSKNQIQRFIRLTELIPELLDMLDERKIALNPAYELSFLKKEEQTQLLDAMDSEQATPSLSQAQRLKKFSQEGHLSIDVMRAIMPAEQIAFIHEANTEVRKKELFSKVRTGQVRVLLGSTVKMGAGTNVQDRLVALHDLDCPWRPGDLAQRKGRIERQGNQNPLVHVYRYVTEGTFDAYLWQTVENKQKFISQIMTSKSPVRSCDDVDETALSFAEIKALCAGDPRIKERMDLDVEVAKLKLMKADHQSKQYRLEDQLLKYFPQEIETNKGYIQGFEADLETLAAHPHPEDSFAGMEIRGDVLTDKENAGAALLDACKEVKTSDPVQIGSYRGFTMSVEFEAWKQEYTLLLKGQMTHRATLGTDPRGNLTRIDNALAQMPQRLEAVKNQLENLYQQQAAAKEEVGKPFPFEDDLRVKSARLVELDTLLNIGGKGNTQPETVVAKSARPSVLDSLKRPVPPRSPEKKPKQHEEVR